MGLRRSKEEEVDILVIVPKTSGTLYVIDIDPATDERRAEWLGQDVIDKAVWIAGDSKVFPDPFSKRESHLRKLRIRSFPAQRTAATAVWRSEFSSFFLLPELLFRGYSAILPLRKVWVEFALSFLCRLLGWNDSKPCPEKRPFLSVAVGSASFGSDSTECSSIELFLLGSLLLDLRLDGYYCGIWEYVVESALAVSFSMSDRCIFHQNIDMILLLARATRLKSSSLESLPGEEEKEKGRSAVSYYCIIEKHAEGFPAFLSAWISDSGFFLHCLLESWSVAGWVRKIGSGEGGDSNSPGAMNTDLKQKSGKQGKGSDVAEKVIVAVKASKEIPRTALVWALTHVVQPGDCITLLVVIPPQSSGTMVVINETQFLQGENYGAFRDLEETVPVAIEGLTQELFWSGSAILQIHINVKIKIVSGSPTGVVATESKKAHANWVVLDKNLKHEEKRCLQDLQCNIVVMKRSQPKVLRLNLVGSPKMEPEIPCALPPEVEVNERTAKDASDPLNAIRGPVVTPTSSPELGTPFTATEAGTSSVSSSDLGTSPFFIAKTNRDLKKEESMIMKENRNSDAASSDSDSEDMSPSTSLDFQPWMAEILSTGHLPKHIEESSPRASNNVKSSTAKALLEKLSKLDREAGIGVLNYGADIEFSGNVREAISLSRNPPPGPPPLCSICQHKAPVFGKPPRWFSYAELELATGGFSQANFLAEGGFGSVHRGILPDGQAVAVKQHKLASSQGDLEFCSEVEVLSCAQHRNVVMLIGFCIEDRRRLLVYEYICNGSLDAHLYGNHLQVFVKKFCHALPFAVRSLNESSGRNQDPLTWSARQKIAVGAARGLRYLHEECRVGCIVHRDMRPNNILITHDFEPLVGDFGLARWQPDGDLGIETRVIGTFGYLAPEYAQSGQITEKADVYSFGVVLIELVTGRKAVDINRPKGQQCLTEWARPLLEEYAIDELVDPRLESCYSEHEVYCMVHAASLCIRRDPHLRPRMSQKVLRILEGDLVVESNYISTPSYEPGSRSGRIWLEQQHLQHNVVMKEALEGLVGKLSYEALRAAYWEREKARRTSSDDDM
ncbi:hypothetical protein ACLOJK_040064 [Asimina triloba]